MSDKQTTRKMPRRLGRIAPEVFAALRESPPDWFGEFDKWRAETLGPRPPGTTHQRAAEEWQCAVLGAVLAWGYFDAMLKEQEQHEAEAKLAGEAGPELPIGDVGDGPDAPVLADAVPGPGAPELDTRLALGARFSVLGPDGAPVVEGLK